MVLIPKNITSCAHTFIINFSVIPFSADHWDIVIFCQKFNICKHVFSYFDNIHIFRTELIIFSLIDLFSFFNLDY